MTQPTAYTQITDYSDELVTSQVPGTHGAHLDQDFQAIKLTTDEIRTNLALIQRDDGALKNLVVTPDSLSAATKALIASDWTPRGAWATAISYVIGDIVTEGVTTYVCAAPHTSGTFSVDLAAVKWIALTLPVTSFIGTLFDDEDAAAARATLGAGATGDAVFTAADAATVLAIIKAGVVSRSSNTILGASDIGKTVIATSTFTQTFDTAANLGDGWSVYYRNGGTGVITLDPNAAETINLLSSIPLQPGDGGLIVCDGAALQLVGKLTGPAFSVDRNGANQTGVVDSVSTKVLHNHASFDTHSAFDAVNSRFVAPAPGTYAFEAQAAIAAAVDQGLLNSAIWVNGVEAKKAEIHLSGTEVQSAVVVARLQLAKDDYVEHYFRHGNGSDATIHGLTSLTYFSGQKI